MKTKLKIECGGLTVIELPIERAVLKLLEPLRPVSIDQWFLSVGEGESKITFPVDLYHSPIYGLTAMQIAAIYCDELDYRMFREDIINKYAEGMKVADFIKEDILDVIKMGADMEPDFIY